MALNIQGFDVRKVLIDASDRHDGTDNMSNKWKKWIFNPDMIAFVTSGRMPQLRELGMAIRYQDWVSGRLPLDIGQAFLETT